MPRRAGFLAVFAIAALVFLTHVPFLTVPFYWDELGQFVPASLDLFLLGKWVPVTTIPNIHPPGLMAYLAMFWSVTGFSIAASRAAMLALASLGAVASFLLARRLGPPAAALLSVFLLCISPLFVAQSMMVQLDMPAMVFTILALLLFLADRMPQAALACVVLVMMKETGVVAPAVFGFWLLAEKRWRPALLFTAPLLPLAIWLWTLRHATGHWAGNESFAAYNAVYSLHPVRFALALGRRLYYLFLGSGHWAGLLAVAYAWRHTNAFRSRGWKIVAVFAAAHVLVVSLFGGAVLERYLMPVLPLLYIAYAAALLTLPRGWRAAAAVGLAAMVTAASFINPPYPFPFENNLAFVTFARLNRRAAEFVQNRFPDTAITTTFPCAGALRRPDFGYVTRPLKVREIPNFELPSIAALAADPPRVLILYSVAWDPFQALHNRDVESFLQTFYGYQPQAATGQVESLLGMRLAARWTERGQWIEVFELKENRAASIPAK